MFENYLTQYRMLIAGVTPIIGSGLYARPAEIRSWLACRPDVENFVILDDDDFWVWDELEDHFVRTVTPALGDPDEKGMYRCDPKRGITRKHAKIAIDILTNKKMPILKEALYCK